MSIKAKMILGTCWWSLTLLFQSYVETEFYWSGERGKLDIIMYLCSINFNITLDMYSEFACFKILENQPLFISLF